MPAHEAIRRKRTNLPVSTDVSKRHIFFNSLQMYTEMYSKHASSRSDTTAKAKGSVTHHAKARLQWLPLPPRLGLKPVRPVHEQSLTALAWYFEQNEHCQEPEFVFNERKECIACGEIGKWGGVGE